MVISEIGLQSVKDEALISFLYRCMQKNSYCKDSISGVLRYFDNTNSRTFDPDYHPSLCAIEAMASVSGLSAYDVRVLSRNSGWHLLSDRNDRRYFCSHCIFSDVRAARHPVWRKTWDYFETVICPKHHSPLSALRDPRLLSDKARVAYTISCIDHLEKYSFGPSDGAWAQLWALGGHVQLLISTFKTSGTIRLGIFNGLSWDNSKIMLMNITALALRAHTRHFEQRCFVSRVLANYTVYNPAVATQDPQEKMISGFSASNIVARLVALIILGLYCSWFSGQQLESMREACRKLHYYLPQSLPDIKRELLLSDISDYETVIKAYFHDWPSEGIKHWTAG